MGTITTRDGTEIFCKDWGQGQLVVFHHGWPLGADGWDAQMMFFLPPPTARSSSSTSRCPSTATTARARHDCIAAFSETNFTEDLKRIEVPTLVMHGEDDQAVPFADAGALSAELIPGAVLKSYPGFPHGMPATHAEQIDADLLAFIKG